MSENDQAVQEFWRRVSACAAAGDVVALLPHTAGLHIRDARPGAEYEAVRAAYQTVLRNTVVQADRTIMTDLVQRGYEPVSFEDLRRTAQDLGLTDTDWTRPETCTRIGRAVEALLLVAGEFTFEVTLVHRGEAESGETPVLGAHQEVRYTLQALDATDGAEVARAALVYCWESLLPMTPGKSEGKSR
jgi:hypothetical protein